MSQTPHHHWCSLVRLLMITTTITFLIMTCNHSSTALATGWHFVLTSPPATATGNSPALSYQKFGEFLKKYTSITSSPTVKYVQPPLLELYHHPWLFVQDITSITIPTSSFRSFRSPDSPDSPDSGGSATPPSSSPQTRQLHPQLVRWLLHGGTAIIEGQLSTAELEQLTHHPLLPNLTTPAGWQPISADHELQRSFYLLNGMPICNNHKWQEYRHESRMMILHVPPGFITSVTDTPPSNTCFSHLSSPTKYRLMTNLIMAILSTDYKKDQLHIREILKRIR